MKIEEPNSTKARKAPPRVEAAQLVSRKWKGANLLPKSPFGIREVFVRTGASLYRLKSDA
jgi:hypothetical protein